MNVHINAHACDYINAHIMFILIFIRIFMNMNMNTCLSDCLGKPSKEKKRKFIGLLPIGGFPPPL